jgi:DnaK suppressor protein
VEFPPKKPPEGMGFVGQIERSEQFVPKTPKKVTKPNAKASAKPILTGKSGGTKSGVKPTKLSAKKAPKPIGKSTNAKPAAGTPTGTVHGVKLGGIKLAAATKAAAKQNGKIVTAVKLAGAKPSAEIQKTTTAPKPATAQSLVKTGAKTAADPGVKAGVKTGVKTAAKLAAKEQIPVPRVFAANAVFIPISTKPANAKAAKTVSAKPAASKTAGEPHAGSAARFPNNSPVPLAPVPTDGKPKKNLAGLGVRDLEHFRELILAKRRELVGDMTSMEREALRSANGTNLSNLPLHMADMGTDNYEQEFTLGLVEKERGLLRELNRALAKIQDGTFGICEGTSKPINRPRLEAQPWARFSIEYARMMERGLVRR